MKVNMMIDVAEEERVWIVAIQETWFKKGYDEDMRRVLSLRGEDWQWFGRRRILSKKDKKGSGGIGFLVNTTRVGPVTAKMGKQDGLMWLELEQAAPVQKVVNLYLIAPVQVQ